MPSRAAFVSGDMAKDREALMKAMAGIQKFEGITGNMSYPATGAHDPIKCAVVVKIDDAGKFSFYKSVCP